MSRYPCSILRGNATKWVWGMALLGRDRLISFFFNESWFPLKLNVVVCIFRKIWADPIPAIEPIWIVSEKSCIWAVIVGQGQASALRTIFHLIFLKYTNLFSSFVVVLFGCFVYTQICHCTRGWIISITLWIFYKVMQVFLECFTPYYDFFSFRLKYISPTDFATQSTAKIF